MFEGNILDESGNELILALRQATTTKGSSIFFNLHPYEAKSGNII